MGISRVKSENTPINMRALGIPTVSHSTTYDAHLSSLTGPSGGRSLPRIWSASSMPFPRPCLRAGTARISLGFFRRRKRR